MTFKTFVVVFVFCIVTKGFSETIHCYECDGCKKLNDSLLRACPMASNSTTTLTPETIAVASISSTIASHPETTSATLETTNSSPPATAEPPVLKEPPQAMAEPSASNEPSQVTEPPATTGPVLEISSTTAAAPSTDEAQSDNSEQSPILKRSVRYVGYRSLMIRRLARETEVNFHCYSIKGYDGDKKKIKKGCVEVVGNKNACSVLKEQYGVSADNCNTCRGNKCNSSAVRNYFTERTLIVGLLLGLIVQNTNRLMSLYQ